MLMSVNVCISHQNQGSFIAQEIIMCCHYNDRHMVNGHIFLMMFICITTYSGVLLIDPLPCFATNSCRHLTAGKSGGQDHWIYTCGAPVRTLYALN